MSANNYIPAKYPGPRAKPVNAIFDLAYEEMLKPFPSTAISDFEQLNFITGGFRPNEFTILCGSTGSGKTTLMANFSASFVRDNIPHFVASVETGPTDFIKRVISAKVREDWNTGDQVPLDKLRLFHEEHGAMFYANALHLSLYDNRFSVETLMADIAWHVEKHGIKVAIIDNLNFFMEVTCASDQVVEMDRVIHELIIFCKQVPVHVIMVMHPKKTDHGRVESEFDIKGSSTAVQEAQNVLLFNRPKQDLISQGLCTKSDREIKIAKMRRRGRAVGVTLILKSLDGVSYQEGSVCQ